MMMVRSTNGTLRNFCKMCLICTYNQNKNHRANFTLHRCLKQTCIEFPPVDLCEEGLSPELVAGAVPEAQPPLRFLHQQALADGAGLLTELLRINHWIVQDALLHHFIFHLQIEIPKS